MKHHVPLMELQNNSEIIGSVGRRRVFRMETEKRAFIADIVLSPTDLTKGCLLSHRMLVRAIYELYIR